VLDDVTLVSGDLLWVTRDKDTLTLTLILRFHDQCNTTATGFFLSDEVVEIEEFIGSDPGLGEKCIVVGERFLQQFQVLR